MIYYIYRLIYVYSLKTHTVMEGIFIDSIEYIREFNLFQSNAP